jgi:hypothetical protein
MAATCALNEAGLRAQLERYRQAGQCAHLLERTPRRLVVDFDRAVDGALLEQAVAIERGCCPWLALEWEPDQRRLTVSVSKAEHEPALDVIGFALDLGIPASHAAPS